MNLKLFIEKNESEKNGKGIYFQNDLSLEYEIDIFKVQNFNTIDSLLVMYDFLTITFNSTNKEFVSLDAYTNKQNWIFCNKIQIPTNLQKGLLKIQEGFNITDRYYFSSPPTYEYSKDGILKINISDSNQPIFYKIAQDLIVGLHHQMISCFIMEKISFE